MKKITFLLKTSFLLIAGTAFAQYGCTQAITITNGFTVNNISTPGAGAGSPAAWVTVSDDCQGTGGSSSSVPNSTCWNQVFDTVGDDYMFKYTTGNVAGESVYFKIVTGQQYMGLKAFTGCSGTTLSGCLSGAYAAGTIGATLSVSASNLPANQTIYFGVGVWTLPNNLIFNVTEFTVTLPLSTVSFNNTNGFKVSPNPVNDILTIAHETKILKGFTIYNLLGQEVMNNKIGIQQSEINVSNLNIGTYLLNLESEDGQIEVIRFIKQ
ncbi:MAG: T9SS type A sorting domain-containing protein [Bacteroidota bacterium]